MLHACALSPTTNENTRNPWLSQLYKEPYSVDLPT